MKTISNIRRTGLTLVELLVVIAIMGLLTALIVPQVRLINKDRNIREAARVVGTALAQARDRAVATGAAGLMIERNTNIKDGNVCYAGTRLYLMRKVPNYQHSSGAVIDWASNPTQVQIALPYGWQDGFIQPGDRIRFDYSSVSYPITRKPGPGGLGLVLEIGLAGGVLPIPRSGQNIPFVIERTPRRFESSRVDLPDGYIIDLRYSGYWNGTNGTTTEFAVVGDQQPIELIFNRDGSLDRLKVANVNGGAPYMARGAIDLFVTEYRPNDANFNGTSAQMAESILANPASLWVTLSHQTGGVNVGYNEPPTVADRNANVDGYDAVLWEIYCARDMSRVRTSANQ